MADTNSRLDHMIATLKKHYQEAFGALLQG
jgi:hypothetical protein